MNFLKFSVLAAVYALSLNAKAVNSRDLVNIGINITSAPTSFTGNLIDCVDYSSGAVDTMSGDVCTDALILAPISTSTVLLLKEEAIQEVQPDAYNFLAGEEISLALHEAIQHLRENAPEFADKSDLEIASLLIQING